MGDSNITRIEPLGAPLDGAAAFLVTNPYPIVLCFLPLWQKEPRV